MMQREKTINSGYQYKYYSDRDNQQIMDLMITQVKGEDESKMLKNL